MKRQNTWMLVEAGMMIGIAIILGRFVKLYRMPMGGSVTAGRMVPLFVFTYRWGWKKGMFAGAAYGLLSLLIGGGFSLHPVSLFLDYPLAYAMVGLAGFYKKTLSGYIGGIFSGIAGRFICHVVSGVLFFASATPEGQTPLMYSVLYNGTFLLPEFVITVVLALLALKYIGLPAHKSVE